MEAEGNLTISYEIWNFCLIYSTIVLEAGWAVKKMVKATIACCRVAFTLLPIVNLAKKANSNHRYDFPEIPEILLPNML